MEPQELYFRLKSLTVYREILDRPVMGMVLLLVRSLTERGMNNAVELWAELLSLLWKDGAGDLESWLWDQLRFTENPWGRLLSDGGVNPTLECAAKRDVETLSALCALGGVDTLVRLDPAGRLSSGLPLWSGKGELSFQALRDWYRTCGCGPFARYRAFLWDGGELLGVADPDAPAPGELIGYRLQRAQVEENTRQLLAGRRVNNVLLFGESGTGKSATVKSLLTLPGADDLRLIEIEKNSVAAMPRLIRTLAGRREKCVLFLDDLAFDQDDMNYSVLKTILEGGLEKRPDNVAIYATSNRRNLVRQTFSDRAGDEVDRDETIQEKTALADRFGLRVAYLNLSMGDYLELVERLARQRELDLPPEELRSGAVRWDARHPGRSPRTARQFIDSL